MLKEINARNIKEYYEETRDNEVANYLGEVLFPPRKQLGLDLSFIKGNTGAPVSLKPSAFDTDVTLRDRLGVEVLETDMPFFKEAISLKEKDRQELLKLEGNPDRTFYNAVLKNVFDDKARLIDSADVVVERMRMQLLTTGRINIEDNKRHLTYDFGFKYEQMFTLTGDDTWDKETADPISDLFEVLDSASDELSVMVLNSKTWAILRRHKSLREYMGKEVMLTNETVKDFIQSEFGLRVAVYDKKYRTSVFGDVEKFIPDGVISFVPEVVGETVYGTTPEEANLMAGASSNVEIVKEGVAVTVMVNEDPVTVTTKVSEIVLPSAEGIGQIRILNTLE